MSINAISLSTQPVPIRQSSVIAAAQVKKLDNDGDYDNGTGKDDIAKKTSPLQTAAQPYLGSNINIRV